MNKKSLATVVILLTTALFASGQEESSPINTVYADLQMLSRERTATEASLNPQMRIQTIPLSLQAVRAL